MKPGRWIYVCCVAVILMACSETKNLKEGQYLYKGPVIHINTPENFKEKKGTNKNRTGRLASPKAQREISGDSI
jgi:hypothetical protein